MNAQHVTAEAAKTKVIAWRAEPNLFLRSVSMQAMWNPQAKRKHDGKRTHGICSAVTEVEEVEHASFPLFPRQVVGVLITVDRELIQLSQLVVV